MDLAAFLSEYKNHPVLFIGTGISKRYYSESYTWNELLSKIVLDYCDDEEHYLDLKSKSMSGGRICNYAHLAQLIENEFNEIAQKERNGKFKAMNDIFYDKMKSGEKISRFKYYVASLFDSKPIRPEMADELVVLKKAFGNIASAITTNYDSFVEDNFGFEPLIGNDILLSNPYGSVYKIHGSISSPESIIITQDDYDLFEEKYELIKAQLISLFIHNPIIFIGYGVNDANIKKLLKTIFTYVEPNSELSAKIRKNFLLVEYRAGIMNTDVHEHDIDIEGIETTLRINKVDTDNFSAIYQGIADLVLPVSAMDIKKVQKVVREIESGGSIKVQIVDDIDGLNNSDRVLAIGAARQIVTNLLPTDFIRMYFDILDNRRIEYMRIINKPKIQRNQYFPVYGFASICEEIDSIASLKRIQEDNVKAYLRTKCSSRTSAHTNPEDIINDVSIAVSYKYEYIMQAVKDGNVTLDVLESFLRSKSSLCWNESGYKRLLCLYDIKKYSTIIL